VDVARHLCMTTTGCFGPLDTPRQPFLCLVHAPFDVAVLEAAQHELAGPCVVYSWVLTALCTPICLFVYILGMRALACPTPAQQFLLVLLTC